MVYFGPICQEILNRYLKMAQGDMAKYLFSPKDAVAYHQQKRAEQRKAKPQEKRKPNRKENPKRTPGDRYKPFSYRRAIHRACDRAKVPHWFPHQLRHLAGTLARQVEGLDGSQHFLGHSNAKTAEIYSEIRDEKAEAVAKKIG